jgi:uncharacterized membrane protein
MRQMKNLLRISGTKTLTTYHILALLYVLFVVLDILAHRWNYIFQDALIALLMYYIGNLTDTIKFLTEQNRALQIENIRLKMNEHYANQDK